MPYIPPNNTSTSGDQSKNKLHLFEKGVTYDLFDPKLLQPLIRNIILSGNERKFRNKKASELNKKSPESANAKPVLNVHRMH
ncbi:MAG: hypothetical protein ABIA63_13605 [bacterium]